MAKVGLVALIEKMNAYCTRSLETAAGMCMNRGDHEIRIEHFMIALLTDPNADIPVALRRYEVEAEAVLELLLTQIEQGKFGSADRPMYSPLLVELLESAWMQGSIDLNLGSIRSGSLLLALLSDPDRYSLAPFMAPLRTVSTDRLRSDFAELVGISNEDPDAATTAPGEPGAILSGGDDSALGKYAIDFTARARAGEIDPVFCRDLEIRQIIDILARRRANNPIVVGDAGVGKTAVVEGLALRIAEGDVPELLRDVSLRGLDLNLLQAGASVKGEFENRLKSVMDEVKASPSPIVLFIDEVHTLIGAGGQAGTGDAANILKPALSRGELRTIAATTWSEYKKYIEKDPALSRRFQVVKLDEPTPEQATTIIRGLRSIYEDAHGVYIRDDAVEAAAKLSARYLSGRQLPDKAIHVLDTACARARLSVSAKPDAIDDQERKIKMLERESEAIERDILHDVADDERIARVGEVKEEIAVIQKSLTALDSRWQAERKLVDSLLAIRSPEDQLSNEQSPSSSEELESKLPVADPSAKRITAELATIQGEDPLVAYEVSPDLIGRVISDWTGIPVGSMVQDEARAVLELGDDLRARIRGQAEGIDVLDAGIRVAKAGAQNPDAPLGVFLLVGPSGVGKTETALSIAELLFGGEQFMTTLNMSEFQEEHTVSRLIGSPPGYVGYGEGGMLTEAVRQRPYSVVLLDEVEKAKLAVMNLFYQVFDKGMLSDGEGREVDFKNTIILLTSNLATDIITEMGMLDETPPLDTMVDAIRPVLSNHFQPALLARMQIVPFYPLKPDAMAEIVDLKLRRFAGQLEASQRINLTWQPNVAEQIASRCTEVETGARNIDHIVNRSLRPTVSTEILRMMNDRSPSSSIEVGIGAEGEFTCVSS